MAESKQYDVFISYRRDGGDKYARTIQQALEKQYRVFLDFDELKDGVFDQRIIDAISSSPVFLLILSRGALDRCVNENDWVRQEILYAAKCGCHIVPVTIVDDNFEGLLPSLPEELRRAVGQHQFSELQMKTLFKASMEQLIHDRIAPYVKREDSSNGIEVHIDVDADCDLFRFKTFVRHLKAGEDNVIHLNPGKYKFDFVSTQEPEVNEPMVYALAPGIACDFIEVELKEKVEEVIAKHKAEEAKHKAEEEARRKAEEEKQRAEDAKLRLIKRDGKYGFADKSGKVVIPCQWEYAYGFSEGLARVQDANWKWGFIDKTGKVVIPCQWKGAYDFSEGLAKVEYANRQFGFIDKTGKVVIPCQWKGAYDFSEGLAKVEYANRQFGFIDKTGKVVIPCQWEDAWSFSEGLARVQDANGKWGFIDKTGKVVSPCLWKEAYDFSEGMADVKDADGKCGFIDKTGKVVIPCQWKGAGAFSEGLAPVKDADGKWGFIDKTGKVVIPCHWEVAYRFYEGLAHVQDANGKEWMIDKTGKVVMKVE